MRTIIAITALALVTATTPALGWGSVGHRIVTSSAIRALPPEVPAFVRSAAPQIEELSREPDRWRKSGEPHDDERDAAHFIKIADDGMIGGVPITALPPTRAAYDTALRSAGLTQYTAGYLPYAIVDGWQQLRTDFAYWRIDRAGERLAKTDEARAWFMADRRLREMLILRDIGVWSHYVGDASQPMHVSVHYASWGDGPNPDGFSTDNGLHWKFEGTFVTAAIAARDVMPLLAPYRDCACAIEARTAAYLAATRQQVVPLYRLEKARAFDAPNTAGKAFAAARLAAAASELRDMILDAWRASADTPVGFAQISPHDVESGRPEVLDRIRGD